MEKLTVLQLSKRTGLSRTQIYHLQTKNKIKIINGKIDLEEAMPAIIELLDKKSNKDSDINFKQILSLLISQNILLQTQLNLAHEREKAYLTELTSYRQSLAQKIATQSSTDECNTQAGLELENDGVVTDENSRSQIESESENQAPLESCQNINKETKSVSEAAPYPLPIKSIDNEMTLPESESGDTKPQKESNEQNDDALVDTPLSNEDDTEPSLDLNSPQITKAQLAKNSIQAKPFRYIPPSNRKKSASPTTQSMTDQDDINKEDFHNSE
ncbi:hypothetical protein [Acinetobacter sp. XS-4]|uniref:hypothetical protein n=1 Tax=Acinetobacter sp. XS-4 TaxID=2923375 RepID=UPI00208F17EA|nr:hypothetical protein [Acinetobacter sp. XS-4]USP39537.1 hypothetical protein MMY79_14030 [Acinetobacter sp. XS-4]